MLKKMAYKKILIIFLSFFILLILYFFPQSDKENIPSSLSYINPKTIPIYLVDNNNLVSRIEIVQKSNDTMDIIDEIINNLTINTIDTDYIPDNFKKIIPENTKIINKDLSDGLLKINFTKELLNISLEDEEKMMEAIIYSLTEIKEVKKIMIFVEGEQLTKLPNSKRSLPNILDRNFGINKVYDINSMKNISKVTTYYISKLENYSYYIPITSYTNNNKEKVEIIIEKLKTSPTYDTNLVSYLNSQAKLLKYEILENSINLSFNNEILNLDNNKIIEEVKYSIALSIRDTYDIYETIFFVDGILMDANFI